MCYILFKGGRWLGGTKEPKAHFSYSTDANNSPIVGRRDHVINIPGEKHVRIERKNPEPQVRRLNRTPVDEQFVKERYIPPGSDNNKENQRLRIPVQEHFTREKYIPLSVINREKMPTPPSNRRLIGERVLPLQEESRQRNAFSTIPVMEEDSSSRKYMTLESVPRDSRNPRDDEDIYSERYVQAVKQNSKNPHVREQVVERRYVPVVNERRSSLGNRSLGTASEGFSVAGIEEEEFDVPELLLSRSRRNSSASSRYRSSSVDRYTLPGNHVSSVGSDGYAVPFDTRTHDRYGFPVNRERRASTGGLESSVYTQPRSRLSASSVGYNEIPRSRLSTSSVGFNETPRSGLSTSSVNFTDMPTQYARGGLYHSETDLQSALRKTREPEYYQDSNGRGRWKFGERRHQFSQTNQGSSMEPNVQYRSTLPNQKTKASKSVVGVEWMIGVSWWEGYYLAPIYLLSYNKLFYFYNNIIMTVMIVYLVG